jgi:hypothetical protein
VQGGVCGLLWGGLWCHPFAIHALLCWPARLPRPTMLCPPTHPAASCLAAAPSLQQNVQYAKMHRDAVRQWGRFPHRNAILGRESTAEEAAAIADGTMPKW